MSDTIDGRLAALGISLPEAAAPAANYVPYVISGNLLFLSGQLPIEGGKVAVIGLVGGDVALPEAQRAAELCAINILAQAKAEWRDYLRRGSDGHRYDNLQLAWEQGLQERLPPITIFQTGRIFDGWHRTVAALAHGVGDIPAIVIRWSEDPR